MQECQFELLWEFKCRTKKAACKNKGVVVVVNRNPSAFARNQEEQANTEREIKVSRKLCDTKFCSSHQSLVMLSYSCPFSHRSEKLISKPSRLLLGFVLSLLMPIRKDFVNYFSDRFVAHVLANWIHVCFDHNHFIEVHKDKILTKIDWLFSLII